MEQAKHKFNLVDHIEVRGARVHNLKNIDVNVPLHKIVGVAGVSGSGKSSLALGVLYAEGSRRYLESLSTYTRRRMTQAAQAQVDEVLYVPAALALHQRPNVPGIRSTFGTGTELLNSLRLMYSRLASHRCPNGHYIQPTLAVAAGQPCVCPVCGAEFFAPSAEELAFNSQGACRKCDGTGIVRIVDESTLVPDDTLTIDEGAVRPWQTLMWSLMKDIARDLGVRTDVPFRELTEKEKDIVFHGPAIKKHMIYQNKTSGAAGEMDFTYFNAVYTVENALSKVKDENGMKRVEKFLKTEPCPDCGGSRYQKDAAALYRTRKDGTQAESLPRLMEMSVDEALAACADLKLVASRLQTLSSLGLGYLTLGEATPSLSGGEAQRLKLASEMGKGQADTVFVFDEPTIGLHPLDVRVLLGVFQALLDNGATVIVIEHDLDVIRNADYVIDMGPGGGDMGGQIVASGTPQEIRENKNSITGRYL